MKPVAILVAFILVFAVAAIGIGALSGRPLSKWCQTNNLQVCSSAPFAGIDSVLINENGQVLATQPASAGVPQPAQPSQPLSGISGGTQALTIKDFSFVVREPYSLSWTAYSGTLRIFNAADDLRDPNAVAVDTVTVTSGAGSKTSWNKFATNTAYKVVLDGGATYYDTLLNPFVFETDKYNKALGTYSVILGNVGNDRLTSADYPSVFVGEKVGTWSITLSNAASLIQDNGTVRFNYSDTDASGQGNIDIKLSNSGANTIIRDAVIHPQNDQSNPLEGNEISTATVQHVSGTDLGIPSTVTTYLTNYVPIKLGNIRGGVSSTDTWTFTVAEANTATAETLHLYFDDLGGYRNPDILVNNLGIAATDITFNFVA